MQIKRKRIQNIYKKKQQFSPVDYIKVQSSVERAGKGHVDGCPLSTPHTAALPTAHHLSPPGANGRRARWAGRNLNDARLNWPALRTSWRDQADERRISAGQPWPAAKQFIMDHSPNGLSGSDALHSGSRLSAPWVNLDFKRNKGMCGALGDRLPTFHREMAIKQGNTIIWHRSVFFCNNLLSSLGKVVQFLPKRVIC